MNEELTNKILDRIDADQIVPLPRWRFLLLNGFFWFFAVLSVFIGGLAVGTTIFLFIDHQQHGFGEASHEALELLLMVPFLWIIVLALFVGIAWTSIVHTRRGYQYRLGAIIAASMALSIILGSVLHLAGLGKMTHEYLNEMPLYNSAIYDSRDAWSRPALGRLAGIVTVVQGNDHFSVIDFSGRIWDVRLATSSNGSVAPESSSGVFIANSVHEWEE
jgi:hypothetical protein